jgi:hypothetical protein
MSASLAKYIVVEASARREVAGDGPLDQREIGAAHASNLTGRVDADDARSLALVDRDEPSIVELAAKSDREFETRRETVTEADRVDRERVLGTDDGRPRRVDGRDGDGLDALRAVDGRHRSTHHVGDSVPCKLSRVRPRLGDLRASTHEFPRASGPAARDAPGSTGFDDPDDRTGAVRQGESDGKKKGARPGDEHALAHGHAVSLREGLRATGAVDARQLPTRNW